MLIKRDPSQIEMFGELLLHEVIAIVDDEAALSPYQVEKDETSEQVDDEDWAESHYRMQMEAEEMHKHLDFDEAIAELNDSTEYF